MMDNLIELLTSNARAQFFTFGADSAFHKKFVYISVDAQYNTFDDKHFSTIAREAMFTHFDRKWSMQYNAKELAAQVAEWGLSPLAVIHVDRHGRAVLV